MITWMRYVPLSEFIIWLCKGWRIEDDFAGTHRAEHAVLMRFDGETPPP